MLNFSFDVHSQRKNNFCLNNLLEHEKVLKLFSLRKNELTKTFRMKTNIAQYEQNNQLKERKVKNEFK